MPIAPPAQPSPWLRRLAARPATLWPVKMLGTMGWIAAFFWLYFWVMRHPAPGTTAWVMPVTPVDLWIGVHDWAVVPYASLWFYVALAPALARDGRELRAYAGSAFALCAGGLLIFWAWPTAVPSFHVDWQDFPTLAFLKSRDGGSNACPSLHVAFAVHSWAFVRVALQGVSAPRAAHVLNAAWAAIVVWSVFATRQHVLVDVVGGVAAGMASVALARAMLDRSARALTPCSA